MAKKNNKTRRKNGFKFPIAVAAGFGPGVIKVWEHWREGPSAGVREMGRIYTGIDFWNAEFNWRWLWYGTLPIVGGILVHKFIGGWLGVNRALGRAGIPFIRL